MVNPKHLRDFTIITVVFLLFGSAIASAVIIRNIFDVSTARPRGTQKIAPNTQIQLIFATSTKSGPKLPHTIETTKVTLVGMPNNEAAVYFNNRLHDIVEQSVSEFKQYYSEMPEPNTDGSLPEKSSYSNTFEPLFVSPRVVSFFHQVWTYGMGAAHGMTVNTPATFDGYLQKEILLTDIFDKRTPYIQFFSDTVTPVLKARMQDVFFETGTAPDAQNFRAWGFAADGFVLSFDAYQVGPYAAGTQTVTIPYAALQPFLSEYGKELVAYIQAP